MTRYKGLFGLAALVASVALGTFCEAATIRDQAGLFQADVVRKAQAQLDRVEHSSGIPIVIETIDAIPGLGKDASKTERETEINREAVRRDREIHDEGLYILISKRDRVISNVLVRQRHAALVPAAARAKIRDAFVGEFRKNQNYDGGLTKGALVIEETLSAAKAPVRAVRGGAVRRVGEPQQSSMLGTFFLIIAGILGVLVVVRILGGLFGRGAGAGYPPMGSGMGAPPGGMPPGGQGYYGPGGGYGGGRGGGFFSGMLGGLGGALAGNWLYDQFSGRHGQTTSSDAYNPEVANPDAGGDAIVGGDDDGGQGASWDGGATPDAGGGWGDSGGGDWGGGGGGDWGGGGGDFGGGGGDW